MNPMKHRLTLLLLFLLAAALCLPSAGWAEDLNGMTLEQLQELQRQLDRAISEKQAAGGQDDLPDELPPDEIAPPPAAEPAPKAESAPTAAPAPTSAPASSVPVTALTASSPKKALPTGSEMDIAALISVKPEGASKKGLAYSVSDPALASVSAEGVLTGKKAGTVTVTAKDPASGKKATVSVRIVVLATKVTINPGSADVFKGKTLKLSAAVYPANATDKKLVWESEDPDIAKVSSNGTVTGVSEGTTWIYARAQDGSYQTGVCHVKVTVPVKKINIASRSITLFKGDSIYASASVEPADATNSLLDWFSSNEKIATVGTTGRVSAKSVGSCTITAKARDGSGVKAKITVYVEPTLPLYTDYLHWRTINYAKNGQFSLDVISNCVNAKIRGFTAEVKCYISSSHSPSVATTTSAGKPFRPGSG